MRTCPECLGEGSFWTEWSDSAEASPKLKALVIHYPDPPDGCVFIRCAMCGGTGNVSQDEMELMRVHATDSVLGAQMGMSLVRVHPQSRCVGTFCCIHNPSNHHMKTWTLNWRGDMGFMERICPCHGDGHPDPDSEAFQKRIHGDDYEGRSHGCHGCCQRPSI